MNAVVRAVRHVTPNEGSVPGMICCVYHAVRTGNWVVPRRRFVPCVIMLHVGFFIVNDIGNFVYYISSERGRRPTGSERGKGE